MSADRWSSIERLYHEALTRPAADRAAFLHEACGADDALRHEVESLLAHDGDASFLSTPAATLDDGRALRVGQALGSYVISARLGEGGMGEVYRARDNKLGRDVAIKVLPASFTADPERLARFEREARLLASLNHPHIGAIYGVEDVDPSPDSGHAAVPALILELVEGETLAERIAGSRYQPSRSAQARSPKSESLGLAMSDALTIASQIAEALEAAHDKGIVHRDLKPANIKITPAGVVKVLDFGLAKAAVGSTTGLDLSISSTISAAGTKAGVILGTAAYMSPGQARGVPVDKRADVWAFGCVLYEMLTGQLAFPGRTISDTIASILQREPDWEALPETTSSGIRRLLRRCLEKDPARRLRDLGDARLDIDEALAAPASSRTVALPAPVRRSPTLVAGALAATAIAAAIGALGIPYLRGPRGTDAHAVRFTLAPPPNVVLPAGDDFTLSPDGRRLAFIGVRAGTTLLYVRSLDALEAQSLPGTEGAIDSPIWSPDNRTVAFHVADTLKSVDVGGGPVRTLSTLPRGAMYGGTWSADGRTIVVGMLYHGLFSVPATGGLATALPNPGAATGEARLFPTFLPDGQHFVYLSAPSNVAWVGSLTSREPPVRLFSTTSQVRYVPGYLVFVQRGAVMAQRFDAPNISLAGEAVQIADGVRGDVGNGSPFATSSSGTLVYRRDPLNVLTQLTWVDRSGRRLGTVGIPGRYRNPELSPDGSNVALEVRDAQGSPPDIWRLELERGIMTHLTSDPGDDVYPVWSPGGDAIMFSSDRGGGVSQLYRIRADGSGEERVLPSSTAMLPYSWAADGLLVYLSRPAFKLGVLPLSDGGAPHSLEGMGTVQGAGQVSPDGRWIAYISPEGAATGSSEVRLIWNVFLQSFPMPGRGKVQISVNGGTAARWSRDSRELFFAASDGRLMAISVTGEGAAPKVGAATALFELSSLGGANPRIGFKHQYDVAKDGRFLLNLAVEPVTEGSFTVVVNWQAALGASERR